MGNDLLLRSVELSISCYELDFQLILCHNLSEVNGIGTLKKALIWKWHQTEMSVYTCAACSVSPSIADAQERRHREVLGLGGKSINVIYDTNIV